MKCGLYQPHSGEPALARTVQHRFHQEAADALVLHRRVDRDRSDSGNRGSFIQTVAADDPAVQLGDHAEMTGMGKQRGHDANAGFGDRDIRRECVRLADRPKGLVANPAADYGVVWRCRPDGY
jgi:hypothetical protein